MSDASVAEGDGDADTEARDLLERLVAIPSPTGEERACTEALVEFLEAHGREAYLDEVGNVRAPADDALLLTSHVDTVPGDIPVRVERGGSDAGTGEEGPVLWGRGSVDAKGPLVAMAVAAVRTGASFAGVVGEEVDSPGARHLIEDREAPDALVNGEPSGTDGITLGYRGILSGTYLATSESGHTSRPENNAIQDAMDWWNRVVARFEPEDEWDPVFEQVTAKPTRFEGGLGADGLSVEATMDVSLRVPPSMTVEEVREIADGELDPEVGTVNWTDGVPPTMQSPRTDVARAFRVAIRGQGLEPRLVRKTGTADMNIYAGEWDCPMVTYGPGDSDLDHAPDERLPLRELDRAVAVLTDAAGRLL